MAVRKVNDEFFNPWNPIPNLKERLVFHSLHREFEYLTIKLVDESWQKVLAIQFDSDVVFRLMDEMNRQMTRGYKNGLNEWSLYEVTNSSFLEWFKYESEGIGQNYRHYHYLIWTIDEVIDVLSLDAPKVFWVDE